MTGALGDEDQVFVDGVMMNLARWPNTSLDVSRPVKAVADAGSYTRGVLGRLHARAGSLPRQVLVVGRALRIRET